MEIVYHLPCTDTHLSLRPASGSGARVWPSHARSLSPAGQAHPRDSMAADRSPVPVEFIFPLKLLSVYAVSMPLTPTDRRELHLETGQPERAACPKAVVATPNMPSRWWHRCAILPDRWLSSAPKRSKSTLQAGISTYRRSPGLDPLQEPERHEKLCSYNWHRVACGSCRGCLFSLSERTSAKQV